MTDRPSSPFTGLDKALVRSTKPTPQPDIEHQSDQERDHTSAPQQTTSRVRTNERSNERRLERSLERTNERTKVRHSFDIYHDQLLHLSEVQANIYRRTGKKPKVGELVQEALDAYIERYNERTNERSGD